MEGPLRVAVAIDKFRESKGHNRDRSLHELADELINVLGADFADDLSRIIYQSINGDKI